MKDELRICLLGDFSLIYDGRQVTTLNADRPQTLLAYLLLHRQAPQSRQRLAFTMWPDSTDDQARANLRKLLHTLRQALPNADAYLALDTHTVQWRPDAAFWLDTAEFQDALEAARISVDPADKLQRLEGALALYRGPLLPNNYDDWIIPLREEYLQAYAAGLNQLVTGLEQAGAYQQAVRYARRWQQQDPLDEAAVIHLLRLYAVSGDRAGVRRAYQICTAALQQELDAEPGPETQAAYKAALQLVNEQTGNIEEEIVTPAPRPATTRASPRQSWQLPPMTTPFFGREVELAQLAQLLADPLCRLLTVVGPGGVGKTRLAVEAAKGHVTVFRHGAAFVPLASISEAALIPSVIAQNLNIPLKTSAPHRTQLLCYLQDKELLLLLDNMEQLNDDVTFLAEIMDAAPGVKILATSRKRLSLEEEWVFDLRGLPLPDMEQLDQLEENSAAALFLLSARQQDPRFTPGKEDRAAIVRICQLVDGMPLGLKLAASWVRLLSCTEIGDEIEKNLDFLIAAHQDMPERHRSMRAVFEQSWSMLSPTEQGVFSCLSLFRGGFDRDAAAQVALATLPVLSSLLDKSLIRKLETGRYDVHELVRQFAAGQLRADPQRHAAAQAQFTSYYLNFAETAAPHLTGKDQEAWLNALEMEYGNLRVVLAWCVDAEDGETAVRLGAALGRFWWLRYRPLEGSNWLRQILAVPGPATAQRARAMASAGVLARMQQAYEKAEKWLAASIVLQRELGCKQDLGQSLNELGMLAIDQGDFRRARALFAEWLDIARELDYPHGISIAQLNLGMAAHHQQAYGQAEELYIESLALARKYGLKTNLAMVLNSYSLLLLDRHKTKKAKAMLRESVRLNETLGYRDGLSWAFIGLVAAAELEGRLEIAARLVGVTDTLRQAVGSPLPPANQVKFESLIKRLQEHLGEEKLNCQRQTGRRMPQGEALDLALSNW
jgi:predicted ATPase/DNA-binding SARP family transcriptional activator